MSTQQTRFDVIVIGGGHAGTEAAAAAARMGARTALVTQSFATVGAMSCNPAIGGLGKGHLVREIDALDGMMGLAADRAGIQFRVLNRRKGPAVRGPRAQADRKLYRQAVQDLLRAQGGLTVVEGEVVDLALTDGRVSGVALADGARPVGGRGGGDDGHVPARADPHRRGEDSGRPGRREALGRAGEDARAAGFRLGRLKTGTPPRLDGRTIDWAGLERQPGDEAPEAFSALTDRDHDAAGRLRASPGRRRRPMR